MNARAVVGELAALAASALWVYCGAALVVATVGDGVALSFGAAVAAAVALSYGLARGLRRFELSDRALRLWGVALSLGLFYSVLRVEIAGDPYLWELTWLGELFADTGDTLEGRAGDVATVVVLAAAWVRGVLRGARALAYERVRADVMLGLVVVLLAAAFAPSAQAPDVLRWLVVPYMAAGLLALSLAHLGSVEADPRRPFPGASMLVTGGALGVAAGVALLAALAAPPSPDAVGDALAAAARGTGTALVLVLAPFFSAAVWTTEHLVAWLGGGDDVALEPLEPGAVDEQLREGEPAAWSRVAGYLVRSAVVGAVVAIALAALWLAFRRASRDRDGDGEAREDVTPEPSAGARSLVSRAISSLRGLAPGRARSHDAIGRLYVAMVRRAAAQGLARPPSATPLEFAGPLERHYGSPVAGAISRAYADARYARRRPSRARLDELRAGWRLLERGRR